MLGEIPEVVLDEDAAPATLTSEFGGGEFRGFVRGISDAKISPDGERLAYTVDAAGDEKYVCEFLPEGVLPPVRDVDACAADAEVEAAMQSEFTEASDASSSLDDLSDRNSPSSVMEIDSVQNWQGPDLRAGAHFFPDGKTRAY